MEAKDLQNPPPVVEETPESIKEAIISELETAVLVAEETLATLEREQKLTEEPEVNSDPSLLFSERKMHKWEKIGLIFLSISFSSFILGISLAIVLSNGTLDLSKSDLKAFIQIFR